MSDPKIKQFQEELNDLVYRYLSDAVATNDKQMVDQCLEEMFHVAGHIGLTALLPPGDYVKYALEGYQDATECMRKGAPEEGAWEDWDPDPDPDKDFGAN